MNVAEVSVDMGRMITRTAGIKGGTPHLAGTGITVRTIVRWHQGGLMPEEIALRIGHITLAQVHVALAFYYANQEMMDREMTEEEAASDRLEHEYLAHHRPTPLES